MQRYAAFGTIVAVALAIRLAGLHAESYTMDEVSEVLNSVRSARAVVTATDGFPPAYHLLLKSWQMLLGGSESGRWLSALLGALTVVAAYQLGKEVDGRSAGLATATLLAVSPLHVWYAQEARAYALLLPVAATALWLFLRALRLNRLRDWLAYGGAALLGLYTHYYFAQLVALHALWLVPSILTRGRDRWPSIGVHLGLVVLSVPLLALLRADLAFQAGTRESALGVADVFYTLYAFLAGFSTGLSLRELHEASLAQAAASFLPWVGAFGACLLLLIPGFLRGVRRAPQMAAYLGYMLAGPLVISVLAASLLAVKFKVSYVAWASLPLLALAGLAIGTGWQLRATRVALAAYVVLAAVSLTNRHVVDRYRNEDVRSAAAYLHRHGTPEMPIVVVAGYMAEPLSFYLGPGWTVKSVPESPDAILPAVLASQGPGLWWIVYTRPFHGDPTGVVHAYLTEHARLDARFPGLDLYRGPRSASAKGEG